MTDPIQPEPQTDSPIPSERPHRPADDTEEVYYEGSPMLRGAITKGLLWIIIGLALIAAPLVAKSVFHQYVGVIGYIILIAAGLIILSWPILRAMTVRYRVTNYRIDYERGILRKDIDTLELWHVEDIKFHQTMVDRILGIGTITIVSHDPTTPVLPMRALPHARHLFDQLKQRIIAVKRQRGVVKMDTGN